MPSELKLPLPWRPRPKPAANPTRDEPWSSPPPGHVIYAVGDVHGRADLLQGLLALIDADRSRSSPERAVLIFLGDYVDRGPETRKVMDILLRLDRTAFTVRMLMGNHEQGLLEFIKAPWGDYAWLGYGGTETLRSYGVPVPPKLTEPETRVQMVEDWLDRMPASHLSLLLSLELTARYGDYFFAHAGARPGVPLDSQSEQDLLWIRDDFLDDQHRFECVVVHGHTPAEEVYGDARRIGVDTGAYATGRLSAVRLEGTSRRVLAVRES